MFIKNQTAKTFYRVIFLFLCEAGIILQYAGVARMGNIAIHTCYYTILSNILCFLYFAYLVILRPKRENSAVKGAVTICIALTGLVFHLLLSGNMNAMGGKVGMELFISNYIVHYVVPIMVFVDYILFTPKGSFKVFAPLEWAAIPLAYLIFALIRAEVSDLVFNVFGNKTSRYPYPFMDFDAIGTGAAVRNIVIIGIGYIALGYLFFALDRLLGKIRRK